MNLTGLSLANVGWAAGACCGAWVGTFMVFGHVAHNYVKLDIGPGLAIEITVADELQWIIIGLIIGLIYRPVPSG